jgi:hypothetical protein
LPFFCHVRETGTLVQAKDCAFCSAASASSPAYRLDHSNKLFVNRGQKTTKAHFFSVKLNNPSGF